MGWKCMNLAIWAQFPSEVLSFEVLNRCEAAGLIKTEAEIDYLDDGVKDGPTATD